MKRFGVTGYTGKIGSLLVERPNFVAIGADVTNVADLTSYHEQFDVIVNCAAISSIDKCEADFQRASEVNNGGLTNLHRVFGERVLNISSDHVFNGRSWKLPMEALPSHNTLGSVQPANSYGLTKLLGEGISKAFGGKTIRLSRTVGVTDPDIAEYLDNLEMQYKIEVPDFFSRNYLHREFAVAGIEHMVNNWTYMPDVVNYAGTENVTMYSFMKMVAMELGMDLSLVTKRKKYDDTLVPRPRKGGLNVSLAKSLGFPMFNISDTVAKLVEEYDS